jgi:hypothetical protein
MTDVYSATDVINEMKKGAKLFRDFGDVIELRMKNETVRVPVEIFDQLVTEMKIVSASGNKNGFYVLGKIDGQDMAKE